MPATEIIWHADPDSPGWQIANPAPGVGMHLSWSPFGARWAWSVWHLMARIDDGTADTEADAKTRAEEAWRKWAGR